MQVSNIPQESGELQPRQSLDNGTGAAASTVTDTQPPGLDCSAAGQDDDVRKTSSISFDGAVEDVPHTLTGLSPEALPDESSGDSTEQAAPRRTHSKASAQETASEAEAEAVACDESPSSVNPSHALRDSTDTAAEVVPEAQDADTCGLDGESVSLSNVVEAEVFDLANLPETTVYDAPEDVGMLHLLPRINLHTLSLPVRVSRSLDTLFQTVTALSMQTC